MQQYLIMLAVVLLQLVNGNSYAQNENIIPLKKGEKLPAMVHSMQLGDSVFTGSLQNFSGKLLLLDFWGTTCPECIEAMPNLVALQNQFKDKLQIVLVTKNSPREIAALWKKFENIPRARKWIAAAKELIFITSDTALHSYFPHRGIPTHVWFSPSQEFKTLAYPSSTTPENIIGMLAGQPVQLDVKELIPLDIRNPLAYIVNYPTLREQVYSYTFWTPFLETGRGLYSEIYAQHDSTNKLVNGISSFNSSILELYRYAYSYAVDSIASLPENRILIEVNDPNKIIYTGGSTEQMEWRVNNSYCFAAKWAVAPRDHRVLLRKEFDQQLGYTSKVEKRKVKCYVLREVGAIDSLYSTAQMRKVQKEYINEVEFMRLQKVKMSTLFSYIRNPLYRQDHFRLYFDGTTYPGDIDILIPVEKIKGSNDLKMARSFLSGYGLDLVEEYREMNMLVICEK